MKRLQQNNYQTQQQFTPSQQPTYISSSTKSIIQYQLENEVAQLKEENYRLKEKLGEKSNKLDEKNKKL
jgi:cell shape-determining protein MreC